MEIGLFSKTWNIEIKVYLHLSVFSVLLIVSGFLWSANVGPFILNLGPLDRSGPS